MDYDPGVDLRVLEAMASNLTPYLYEDELYGTLGGRMPRLTVGGLLLRLRRLQGLEEDLDDEMRQRLHDANINFEQLRSEWSVHYEQKLQREIEARLNNIRAYTRDYAEDSKLASREYGVVAEQRTMLVYLKQEAKKAEVWTEEFDNELAQVDRALRGTLEKDREFFLWADVLQPVYPRETFWWLYSRPFG